jgi:hypothetical protein
MSKKSAATQSSGENQKSGGGNHRVYTGSFAALEARWIETIVELQRQDPLREINVLTGSNILATYLKPRFAQSERILTNVRLITFLDMARRLASVSENITGKRRLPPMGKSIILERVLAEHTPSVYLSLAGLPGFRDALLDTFRDLRDAGVTARKLLNVFGNDPELKDRQRHLEALADLYGRFRERVEFFHDEDDDFRAAIRNLANPDKKIRSQQLLVYGIYDATGLQSRLLEELKNSFDMTYFIPYVDEYIGAFAKPFLQTRVDELGVKYARLAEKEPARGLDHLAAGGFGFAAVPVPDSAADVKDDGSFALVSVPGESRAAVEIVREIFRAVREGIISGFHEAAVILRQPENDISILSETFRIRNVPYFIHGGSRFSGRPLSRAVVALSNLESNSYSRAAVFTAMELVAAALPEESGEAWDVQAWRSLTNDARFLAGLQSWDKGTKALVAEDDDMGRGIESAETAARRLESAHALGEAWQLLKKASSGWPAGLSWADWADYLEHHFEPLLGASEDWAPFTTVLDDIRNLKALDQSDNRDSGFESLKPADTAAGICLVSAEKFKAALGQAIESLCHPEGQFQRRGVNLLSTSAARGLRFPLVIIPALEEGRFPAKLRQDPLLLDSERRSIGGLPIKSKRVEEERLLFDMAARSAEKRLVLMTSRLEESSDRERIPSQFFLRVAAAVRGRIVAIRDLSEGAVPGFRSVSLDNPAPSEDEPAVDEGEIRLRLIAADRATASSALKALEHLEPYRLTGPLAYDQARWAHRLTSYDGLLSDPKLVQWAARTLGTSAGPVSASRLEEYAKCPYYFYLKRGMALSAWEEPAALEGMDPLERGSAVHSILESYLKNYCSAVLSEKSEEKLRRNLDSMARETLERARPEGIPDLLWEIERDTFLALLDRWLSFERGRVVDGLIPVGFEMPFGRIKPNEEYPAYLLQAGRHTVEFRGIIDRVDVSRDGKKARVIDYKTGSRPDSMKGKGKTPLMSGERIQLVIYKGALSVLDAFKSVEAVEGEYLHLQPKDGQIVPCSFTDEELQIASRKLAGILEIFGDGIESGKFFAKTTGAIRPYGHCEYCDYVPICGKDRVQREERKANDPAVRIFMKILEPTQ